MGAAMIVRDEADRKTMCADWEIVCPDHGNMVRRIRVPSGYLYQVQKGFCVTSSGEEPLWCGPILVLE